MQVHDLQTPRCQRATPFVTSVKAQCGRATCCMKITSFHTRWTGERGE